MNDPHLLGALAGIAAGAVSAPLTMWAVRYPSFRPSPTAPQPRWPPDHPLIAVIISAVAVLAGIAVGTTAGARPVLGATLVGCLGAVTLGAIDLVWMHIPARTTYGVATAVLWLFLAATVAAGDWPRLVVALGTGTAAFLIFGGAHLLSPSSIGFGDVRMAALVAMCAGWYGAAAVVSCMLGALASASAVPLVLLARGRASHHVHLPLGPFLAVSLVVAMAISA